MKNILRLQRPSSSFRSSITPSIVRSSAGARVAFGFVATLSFALGACSGGGGASGAGSIVGGGAVLNPPTKTLNGLAAEGAPVANGLVEIRDANGRTASATTDAQGKFSADVSNLDYPVMLRTGSGSPYFSVSYGKDYVNVTPLTTLALARMLQSSPENAFSGFTSGTLKDAVALGAAAASVAGRFPGLAGMGSLDFFSQVFTPRAGDPYDDLLERLKTNLNGQHKSLTELMNEIIAENTPGAGSCPTGEHPENGAGGACVSNVRACAILNGAGQQIHVANYWNACEVVSCHANYAQVGQLCLPVARACATLPAHATAGTETWAGSAWAACQIRECEANYDLSSNQCVSVVVAPIPSAITFTATPFVQARSQIESRSLGGGRTLVHSRESSTENGYLFDSTATPKTFIDPNGALAGYYSDGDTIGNQLYYQLSEIQSAGKLPFFRVDATTGGTAVPVSVNQGPTAGYHESGRIGVYARGTNLYYKARVDASAISGNAIYKLDTVTGATSLVMPNLDYRMLTYPERLASQNLLVFFPENVSGGGGGYKLQFSAIDVANDQTIALKTFAPNEYRCFTNALSPFHECAPVFLEGRALFILEHVATGVYRMLSTDGTVAGTSLIDVPYHYGYLGSATVFQNKLVFVALRKDNLSDGNQLYGYSHAEGFHLVRRINKLNANDVAEFSIKGIATTPSEFYVLMHRTKYEFVGGNFTSSEEGQILKSQGSANTTSVHVAQTNAEVTALLKAGAYDRGPFIALKGQLVFTTSASLSNFSIKLLNLADQSVSVLKTGFTGGIVYQYKKDPNAERIFVTEPVTAAGSSNLRAKLSVIE